MLEVGDEDQLLEVADRCPDGVLFYEPDISEHTALSVIDTGSRFSNLRLAGAAMT